MLRNPAHLPALYFTAVSIMGNNSTNTVRDTRRLSTSTSSGSDSSNSLLQDDPHQWLQEDDDDDDDDDDDITPSSSTIIRPRRSARFFLNQTLVGPSSIRIDGSKRRHRVP